MTDVQTVERTKTKVDQETERLLQAALSYAERGWYVIPCDAEKHPIGYLVHHGLLDATREPATIRRWWGLEPTANIGISCGPSHLAVVDVDVKKGAPGLVNWLAILEKHGSELADTLSEHTPTSGLHYLYRMNGLEIKSSTGKLAPGIDVKAIGGYVVVAPSRTAAGLYSWDNDPNGANIADFPQVLFDLLATPATERAHFDQLDTIPEGERNETLASLAGTMRRPGMSEAAIGAALLVENAKCNPPLPEAEVLAIAKSVAQYEPAIYSDIDYLKMHQLTQLGNAERLIRLHGHDLRHCDGLGGWLCWDEQRWKVDDTGTVELLAKSMSQVIYAEILQTPDKTQQGKLAMCAMKAESLQFVKGTLALAWSEPGIPTTPDVWDRNGWLLNVQNGTLDLRTGILLPHCQVDLITKLAPVTYNPDASDPVLDRYLADVTRGDPDLLSYLQRAAGYSLTGDTREEVFFLMLGKGGGGKSTFVEMMLAMLGDYGVKAGFDTFLEGKTTPGSARSDLMAFRGARFVGATETAKTRRLAESMVKELTGGDTVSARELHHKQMTFTPSFKVWLAANFAPEMSDDDTGIWRRLKEIPFDMVLSPDEVDEGLKIHLKTDHGARSALLNWLLDGCLQWQAGKLGKCPIVERATSELRASFDPLAAFLDLYCTFSPHAEVEAKSLRAAYDAWRVSEGVKEGINDKDWGQRLKGRGCHSGRGRHNGTQATLWYGIGLQSEQSEELPF